MSDNLILCITSVGLGIYALYLLSKLKAIGMALQKVFAGIYDGDAVIVKINGRYLPKLKQKSLQCQDNKESET